MQTETQKQAQPTSKIIQQTVNVRWNAECKQWSILDKNNKPRENFTHGIMKNVSFETIPVSEVRRVGCASETIHGTAGLARGELTIGTFGTSIQGWKNLGFDGASFTDTNGQPIESANELRLLPERRALYR